MTIAIIGGGAAGLMTAATILEFDQTIEVVLIERNKEFGKKVVISGGGRCNVTTGLEDIKVILTNYPRGNKFLISAMYAFPPQAVQEWFEAHGVPLFCQDDMRIFPKSNKGSDIITVFKQIFQQKNIRIQRGADISGISKKKDKRFILSFKNNFEPLTADIVVLATGGQAYRHTGSTGDGYSFALSLGHTITPLAPGLTALTTKETWLSSVAGLSFQKATLQARHHKKYVSTGPFIFTHKGISGPATFAFSSLIAFEKCSQQDPLPITIDLFPDKTPNELTQVITILTKTYPARAMKNVIGALIPHSLSKISLHITKIEPSLRCDQLSKSSLSSLAHWLKNIPLTINGRVGGDEFVTAGGIPLHEINPQSMESLVCPGLYFAGEIMNIDGFTGGFNLQASWATGRKAGEHIVHKIQQRHKAIP